MAQTMTDPAAPTALPVPKRGRRMPASMLLAVVAGLLALVGTLVLLNGQHPIQVAVAARPLVAGEIVRDTDVRYVDVSASGPAAATLLKPADVARLSGRQANRNIPEGGFVTSTDLVEVGQAPQLRAMSIPIDPTRAAGGSLSRADTVDVIDSSTGTAVYVVVAARVLSAGDTSNSKIGGSNAHYAITVAVDDASALRLAAAITNGKVDVVRSTGAAAVSASSPPTSVKR